MIAGGYIYLHLSKLKGSYASFSSVDILAPFVLNEEQIGIKKHLR